MKKMMFWAVVVLLIGFRGTVLADCADVKIGCYGINTQYVPYQKNLRYTFKGNVSVGQCWQWWPPGCYWCSGKTVRSIADDCRNKYGIVYPNDSIRQACENASFPVWATCEILGGADGAR